MSAFEEQELKKLANALAALTPRPAHLDRDGILFEAGRRSARPAGFWPWTTAGMAVVAGVLAVALAIRPEPPIVVQFVEVPQKSPSAPAPAPDVPPEQPALPFGVDDAALPLDSSVRLAAAKQVSANNLKQLSLALHHHHDRFQAFPAPANFSQDVYPLLSWRVHILPFLGQGDLYKQFKLDEPWDSAHNKDLIAKMPAVYRSPLARNVAAGKTVYLGAAGPKMVFGGAKGLSVAKITDGTSNTIMIVEANDDNAVNWTQPEDFKPDKKDPTSALVRKDMKGFHAAFADGSVRTVSRDIAAEVLWSFLTADGGEVIEEGQESK